MDFERRLASLENADKEKTLLLQAQASTIEAQRSSLLLLSSLSSTVARLSSENETLKRTVDDQDRVIGELTRASLSDGFWIWESEKEGRGEGGRWVWSSERYRSLPSVVARSVGPPTSLESLPNELVDAIVRFLPRADQLRLSRCSFRLLQVASRPTYGSRLSLKSKEAAPFIGARITELSESSGRVRSLLLPKAIRLRIQNFSRSDLSPLLSLPSHLPRLRLPAVVMDVRDYFLSPFLQWSPLLRLVDPSHLHLDGRSRKRRDLTVSMFRVSKDDLSCTSEWQQLASFNAYGRESVPVFEEDGLPETFALWEVLLRKVGEGTRLRFETVQELLSGGRESEEFQGNEIASHFDHLPPTDLSRSRYGAQLEVRLVERTA